MRKLVEWLNGFVQKIEKKRFSKKTFYSLRPEIEDLFKKHGEGLYVCNLKSKSNNIVAKAIGFFSRYRNPQGTARLSHTIVIYYGDLSKYLDASRRAIIESKLSFYYLNVPKIEDVKCMVLASADDSGMNYFSFSTYQNREFSLRKVDVGISTGTAVCWFIDQYNRNYDFTGLVFWPFYKLFKFLGFLDDSSSWYCSEVTYEGFKEVCIFIAREEDPSPADIERYNDLFFDTYRTANFLD